MKLAGIVVVAVLINVGLFVLMEVMVERDRVRVLDAFDAQTIDFVRTPLDDETRTKDRRRKPPPKPEQTKKPQARVDELLAQTMELPTPVTALDVASLLGAGGIAIGGRLVDGRAGEGLPSVEESNMTPLSKLPPQYPPYAQLRQLEGYVQLQLTVREDGTVGEVLVLDAHPGNVFVKAAERAAYRWRYRPVVRDGVAIPVIVAVRVDFELED